MFLEVMRDIEAVQKESDGFLEQAKILVISHDISFQLFFHTDFLKIHHHRCAAG